MADDDDTRSGSDDQNKPKGMTFSPEEIEEAKRELDKGAKFSVIEGGKKDTAKPKPAAKSAAKICNEAAYTRELEENEKLADLVYFDTFSGQKRRLRPVPGSRRTIKTETEWEDNDAGALLIWFQNHGYPKARLNNVKTALNSYAANNAKSAAIEWFKALPEWDEVKRFDEQLIARMSIMDDGNEQRLRYIRHVLKVMFLGVVCRVFEPGYKFDYMPIIEGKEEFGKSLFLEKICPNGWYCDSLPSALGRDAMQIMQGMFICEDPEILLIKNNKAATSKAFVTSRKDRTRFAYRENVSNSLRTSIIVGTTNEFSDYLIDVTGNRRFLPFRVDGPIDIKWIEKNRDQLWAEALAMYYAGQQPILPKDVIEAARAEQRRRVHVDDWTPVVLRRIEQERDIARRRNEAETLVSYAEVYASLDIPAAKQNGKETERLLKIFRLLGQNERHQRRKGGIQDRYFIFPTEPENPE